MSAPQVSVIMGVHNAERFVGAAVESVLAQTFPDFELILVEDGSVDDSLAVLRRFDDRRIRILRNPRNCGHPSSLNNGLAAARAPLIARMDADDVAVPSRLERQIAAMRSRPELDVLGTWTVEIDEHDRQIGGFDFPGSEALIAWGMSITNVVYHPTVLMRRARIQEVGGYDPSYPYSDDYDLFTRVLMAGGRIGILPERLLLYRRSSAQISSVHKEPQQHAAARIRQRYVSWLVGGDVPLDVASAAAALQKVTTDSLDLTTLPSAVHLVHRIRRRCLRAASSGEARDLNWRVRRVFLYHAARLRERGRHREAALLWRESLRCGAEAWLRPSVWREAVRLAAGLRQRPVPSDTAAPTEQ